MEDKEDNMQAIIAEYSNLLADCIIGKNALANYYKIKSHLKAFNERIADEEITGDIAAVKAFKALAYNFYKLKDDFEELILEQSKKKDSL